MVRTIDHTYSLDHTANAYPVLCSIEWVSVFLPSLDKTLIHRKLTLPLPLFPSILSDFRQQFVSIHSYSRALQHKGPARVRPWTSRSGIHANHNNIDPCFLNRESALRFTNLVRNLKHSWRCRICLNHFSMPSSTPNQISSAAFAVKLWWKHCSIFPPLCVDLFLALQDADNALLLYGHW